MRTRCRRATQRATGSRLSFHSEGLGACGTSRERGRPCRGIARRSEAARTRLAMRCPRSAVPSRPTNSSGVGRDGTAGREAARASPGARAAGCGRCRSRRAHGGPPGRSQLSRVFESHGALSSMATARGERAGGERAGHAPLPGDGVGGEPAGRGSAAVACRARGRAGAHGQDVALGRACRSCWGVSQGGAPLE